MTVSELILGEARRAKLSQFGFPDPFIQALHEAPSDPITGRVVASSGEVLAELLDIPGVGDALPPGRVVPVCHKEESQLAYYLLVEGEGGGPELVYWEPAATEPVGSALAFMTELVIEAFEGDLFEGEGLEPHQERARLGAWADRIGHPAGTRLVAELYAMIGTDQSANSPTWRERFLASI